MERRELIKYVACGAALNLAGLIGNTRLRANPTPQEIRAKRGLPPLKITNVKAIITAPP